MLQRAVLTLNELVRDLDYLLRLSGTDANVRIEAQAETNKLDPFSTTRAASGVWVHGELDGGALFKIYLPRPNQPPELSSPLRPAAPVAGTETILLAQDDEVLRSLTRELLEDLGYTMLEAANAAEALTVAAGHRGRIHLVVCDLLAPEAVGRDLAHQFAQFWPQTRVLNVSGLPADTIAHRGAPQAGLGLLQKPFSPAALVHRIREMLDVP